MKNLDATLKNINIYPSMPQHKQFTYQWARGHYDKSTHFIYVLEGSFILNIAGESYVVQKNQMALLPRNTSITYWNIPSKPPTVLWFVFRAECEEEDYFDFMGMNDNNHVIYMNESDVMNIFQEIISHPLSSLKATNYTLCASLLLRLCTMYTYNRIMLENAETEFQDIIAYMHQNITKDISLNELADQFHFNPTYFVKKFKKHVGISPMKYFAGLKTRHIANLLKTTDTPATQLAADFGFSDFYYFREYFERYTGLRPELYRELCKPPIDLHK